MYRFSELKVSTKLSFAFSATVLIMIAIGVFGLFNNRRLSGVTSEIYLKQVKPYTHIAGVSSDLKALRISVFRSLAESDAESNEKNTAELKKRLAGLEEKIEATSQFWGRTSGNQNGTQFGDSWARLKDSYLKIFKQVRDFEMEDALESLSSDNQKLSDRTENAVAELQKRLEDHVRKGFDASQAIEGQTTLTTGIMLIAGVVLSVLLIVFLNRSIPRPFAKIIEGMTEVAERVALASGQVADSSQSLSGGASQQAASLEETSSTLEEIANMTRQTADNTQEADGQAGENRTRAEKD